MINEAKQLEATIGGVLKILDKLQAPRMLVAQEPLSSEEAAQMPPPACERREYQWSA